MREARERMYAAFAFGVLTVLIGALVAVMITQLLLPMVSVTERMASDGDVYETAPPQAAAAEAPVAAPSPWRWLGLFVSLISLGTAVFAARQMRRRSSIYIRWMWLLRMSIIVTAGGLLVYYALTFLGPQLGNLRGDVM